MRTYGGERVDGDRWVAGPPLFLDYLGRGLMRVGRSFRYYQGRPQQTSKVLAELEALFSLVYGYMEVSDDHSET